MKALAPGVASPSVSKIALWRRVCPVWMCCVLFVHWRSGGVIGLSALRPGMYIVKLCTVRLGLMLSRGISPVYSSMFWLGVPGGVGVAAPWRGGGVGSRKLGMPRFLVGSVSRFGVDSKLVLSLPSPGNGSESNRQSDRYREV